MLLNPYSEGKEKQRIFEGLTISLTPAPISLRMLCFIIDLGVIAAILYPLLFIGMMLMAIVITGSAFLLPEGIGGFISILVIMLLSLGILFTQSLYFIYFERKSGQTPGKKLFGLQVISFDQQALTTQQILLREVARIVDVLMIIPGILSMALTEKNQRLGDLLAGTMVIRSRTTEEQAESHYMDSDQFYAMLEELEPTRLGKEVEQNYLQFCFSRFTMGAIEQTNSYLTGWINYIQQLVGPEKAKRFDATTLLRFYAEFSHKSVNKG